MNLADYRASLAERQRTEDLLQLLPPSGATALDVGARDGHFSCLLAERFERVVALDLSRPQIEHPRVECVEGDAAKLDFPDASFDFVFCAEVLEHIPPRMLPIACAELARVARKELLIGVPYRQDIRVARSTCYSCGGKNPPWGHVNRFDEMRIRRLFPACRIERISFVGSNAESTNFLSTLLMDWAGNPYGTYTQDEPCVHCGAKLLPPPERSAAQRVLTKLAFWARSATQVFARPHANWMHVLLMKA